MGKTNAERQAEYRLRQKELGDKRRLNIWLSPAAHKRLCMLTKQQGMSQQGLIEWLLTFELGVSEKVEVSSEAQRKIAAVEEAVVLRNGLTGGRAKHKPKKSEKLPGNELKKVAGKEGSSAALSQQDLEFPSQFELKL